MEPLTYVPSKTTFFFYRINVLIYIIGYPNFWIEELKFSKFFIKMYDGFNKINNTLIHIMVLFEFVGYFTQHNLTEKQKFNLSVFCFSHPIICSYRLIATYHKKNIRKITYKLTVALKEIYNDPEVERKLIASTVLNLFAVVSSTTIAMVMYTFDAYMDVVKSDLTFTTIVPAYPDTEDRSPMANAARAIFNLIWWIFLTRIVAIYIVLIPLTTCLSHQYKNLQSYFYNLNNIFERKDLSQREKEYQYEEQFKLGIKMHADTLRCTRQTQTVCSEVFSAQIIFNVVLIVILLAQTAKSERTLSNLCATCFTASSILIGTGFLMWTAGDVTIEASKVSTAIYSSGWQHCQKPCSTRISKILTITINHAQRPVVLKGLGYIDLSYESYLRIVKSSYSVFSVLF